MARLFVERRRNMKEKNTDTDSCAHKQKHIICTIHIINTLRHTLADT